MCPRSSWLACLPLLIIMLFTTICCSCNAGPPPSRGFTAHELLIDETTFPLGWYAESPFELAGPTVGKAEEYERVGRSFYDHGNRAIQKIYRYGSDKQATQQFHQRRGQIFKSDQFTSEWITPEELTYQSSFADQFHLACATRSKYICQALGQYEEYIIVFSIDMIPYTNITYADLERILQAIDERMIYYLELDPQE